jgi:hypothetical protein
MGLAYSWDKDSGVGVTVEICDLGKLPAGKIVKVVVKYQNSAKPSNQAVPSKRL